MDFDELSVGKPCWGFCLAQVLKTERGFTIERKPEPRRHQINAFDVFHQHINDVAVPAQDATRLK